MGVAGVLTPPNEEPPRETSFVLCEHFSSLAEAFHIDWPSSAERGGGREGSDLAGAQGLAQRLPRAEPEGAEEGQ